MTTKVEENKVLHNFGQKLMKMEEAISKLNSQVDKVNQEQIVSKLEDLCTMLKSAVIDFNLKLPPLVSFERYLRKLTDIDDLFYVMDIIHQCWVYLHPSLLFDRPTKLFMSQEEIIERALSNYSGPNPDSNYDFINQEVDRHNISELTILAANAYNKMDVRYKDAYGCYMDGLLGICKNVCSLFDINLCNDFTIPYTLTSKTELSINQIKNVFTAVANSGRVNSNPDTMATFLALFSQSISAVEHQIQWLDVAKSGKPNYASLYVMFKTMGVEMNRFNRSVICMVFTTPQGAIDPDQLKSRETNDSDVLKSFEGIVREAL